MTLHTLFDRLLPEGAVIDYLKVDTQGTALEVIESAGPEYIERIQAVVVDSLIDGSVPLYAGQNTCSESLVAAERWGFHVVPNGTEVCCIRLFIFASATSSLKLLEFQASDITVIAYSVFVLLLKHLGDLQKGTQQS